MVCKKCGRNAADVGYREVVERKLVPGFHVALCLDCAGLFNVAALESEQYLSLCMADVKAQAAIAGGSITLASEYTKTVLDAKHRMMDWTLAWLDAD